MAETKTKSVATKDEPKVEIIDDKKKKDAKTKAREIAKLSLKDQEKELDRIFTESIKGGIEVLKELIIFAKESDKYINQANKDLLDFYDKELNRIAEIIKDDVVTEEERIALNDIRKVIIEKSSESTERTQKMHQEARNEAIKNVAKEAGKVTLGVIIVGGCLKALDMTLKYLTNRKPGSGN